MAASLAASFAASLSAATRAASLSLSSLFLAFSSSFACRSCSLSSFSFFFLSFSSLTGKTNQRLVFPYPAVVLLITLPGYLLIYLLFKLDQHRRKHPNLGTPASNLQQSQHHVFLILTRDQVLRLKHDNIHHLQQSAKLDEVVNIVPSEPKTNTRIVSSRIPLSCAKLSLPCSRGDIFSDGEVIFRNRKTRHFSLDFAILYFFYQLQRFMSDSVRMLKLN